MQDLGGCNEFTFDATSSFDPDNQALTFHWDFGDGNTSEEAIITHRYTSGGEYNVILTVQDSSGLHCDTAVSSQVVTVNTPPVCDFTGPDKACTEQTVTFDASNSHDNEQSQLSYEWNFGDGTSGEGAQVSKTYEHGGRYSVSLSINDNANTTCSTSNCGMIIAINSKPVAHAGDDVELCLQHNEEYNVSFNGSRSADEDNDKLTYRWDFGDGTSSDSANATHLYQSQGEYIATLYVDDQTGTACSSSSDAKVVKLNKAPKAIAVSDTNVCLGTPVNFDGSGSIGEEGETLQYSWDFGDGTTGSGISVAHAYEQGGNYKAILTVDDMQGTSCSTSIEKVFVTVNARPTAVLNAIKVACTGDQISFDASGTNDPDGDALTYTWDFGDGSGGSGSNPTHAYDKGGNYSVQLKVDDKKGTDCSSDVTNINVRINTPPVADAGPNHVCCLDTVSEFDGSQSYDADGDTLTYTWDFGDGNTGDGAKVTHVYKTIGKYLVTLTVNDNSGTSCDTATDSFTAVVNATPTSIIKVR
jgi:PKD repeat protein